MSCLMCQLFKGTMYHCDGEDVSDVVTKIDCINKGLGYYWVNEKYNFDNLGQVKHFTSILPVSGTYIILKRYGYLVKVLCHLISN